LVFVSYAWCFQKVKAIDVAFAIELPKADIFSGSDIF
jgi:hypothetical protein